MLALTLAALAIPVSVVLWIIGGVLADKAADHEWRDVDRAWAQSGRNVMDALSLEVRARQDRPRVITLG